MGVVQMRTPHAQVDIQLTAAALLAGLELSKLARDADHLVVSDFIAEKIRLHGLSLECFLRASQLRLHGPQYCGGFGILGFKGGRKIREQNSNSNRYSQVQVMPPENSESYGMFIPSSTALVVSGRKCSAEDGSANLCN